MTAEKDAGGDKEVRAGEVTSNREEKTAEENEVPEDIAGDENRTESVPHRSLHESRLSTFSDTDSYSQRYLFEYARAISRLFCPCTGFAYNSLSGEKNIMVSTSLESTEASISQMAAS
jgi:hypothetical protein